MKKKSNNIFWMSFSDLMTSLFFVVLVLYVLTYIMLQKRDKALLETVSNLKLKELENEEIVENLKRKEQQLYITVEELQNKLKIFDLVEENLKPIKNNSKLFRYEETYKRFTLAFDVNFEIGQYQIKNNKLKDYASTSKKIKEVGLELQKIINHLAYQKTKDKSLENVSYLLIISGYASHLLNGSETLDYELSYKRAYNLWKYWKTIGVNFENERYKGLIDLQVSGNGWGGIGRFTRDPKNQFINEKKNQRFIIQIVPKIGNAINQ